LTSPACDANFIEKKIIKISKNKKMKQVIKLMLFVVVVLALITGCKKAKTSPQFSAGTGSYVFNGTSVNTKDTLAPDPFSGGKDVTMWPATGGKDLVFVYNMPAQGSGTFPLTDGTSQSSVYILGHNGQINFSSTGAPSDILTKTGTNTFTFSCTVADDSNPGNTYTLTGSGSY